MSGPGYRRLTWPDVHEGQRLPPVVDPVDVQRVIATAAATWVFFGGHIDPEYARAVQGRQHIYLATGPILGLLDRYVTSWAGPEAFLAKRSVRLVDSLYAGDELHFGGVVTRKWVDRTRAYERSLVDIDLEIRNRAGQTCVLATVCYQLPTSM